MEIKGKSALVTGGANGLGFAYVEALLQNGARNVAILDLANSNGEGSVAKLEGKFRKGSAIFIPCDVTKPDQLEAAFEKTNKEFNGIDIIINNAGIMDDVRWELEININVTAVVRSTMLGLDYMGKHKGGKGGTVVNISSVVGLFPLKGFPVYTGTKHAVVGLSRAFAEYYETTGVRVLVMCPGRTDTPLINDSSDKIFDMDTEEYKKILKIGSNQTIDNVAEAVMHIIKNGGNGSVWVSEEENPVYEISFPFYQTLTV